MGAEEQARGEAAVTRTVTDKYMVRWQVVHEERVVHGDLKPANFLMVRKELKLIDFGIAKRIESDNTTNIIRENAVRPAHARGVHGRDGRAVAESSGSTGAAAVCAPRVCGLC